MTYRLTGKLDNLKLRAVLLSAAREFFAARGLLEVETPAMSAAGNTDPSLHSITARARSLGNREHYLHTSPEHAMKRLLAANAGDMYQICRVFRDEELGRWHQPEFTLLEWYRIGWSEHELMGEVEALVRNLVEPHRKIGATVRLSYAHAFESRIGCSPYDGLERIRAALCEAGIDAPTNLTIDELRDLAMASVVVPAFDADALVFVHDYPATQAALARIKAAEPPTAARFETFLAGVELANGFHELADADEQLRRFEAENRARQALGLDALPIDTDLIAALQAGLPDCAGVALGFDRLVAIAARADCLEEVMAFTHTPVK